MDKTVTQKIRTFPHKPGVYLMKGEGETVLYVGKALDLRKRVQSYWSKQAQDRYQIQFLLKKIVDLDCVVTDTEKEALILENTLIKKYKPKYNFQLRDDKSHPSIKLNIKHQWPRVEYTRKITQDGSLYYGPYTSAHAARQLVDFVEKHFLLRTCSDRELAQRTRPCLEHQIGRCSAPCVGLIDENKYADIIQQIKLFLEGKDRDLVVELTQKMNATSESLEYEAAAQFRDLIAAIEKTLEKQKMYSHKGDECDFVGLYREGELGMFNVLQVREGKVDDNQWTSFKDPADDDEILESFLMQYYTERRYTPRQVMVQLPLPNQKSLEEIIAERVSHTIKITVPQRGEKFELMRLAIRNANEAFQRRRQKQEDLEEILETIEKKLSLEKVPHSMECFDISNIQGKDPVASMVRFEEGEAAKVLYRKFKIKTLPEEPNDYAMMHEVLTRRIKQADKWPLPNLLVVDGGKGHLAIAETVLSALEVTGVELCSIAKPHGDEDCDKIYRPGRKNPIKFLKNASALHLFMRLRDEAHRFAIGFHKKLREKKVQKSKLDEIPGLGPAKKKILLKHFGSLKRIEEARLEDLKDVPGIGGQLGGLVYAHLHQ
jgi:excinuclease ABC subunit C